MQIEQVRSIIDDPQHGERWLAECGLRKPDRGYENIARIAHSGMSLDLLVTICQQLQAHLPVSSDPELALNTLDRFVESSRSPLSLGSLFQQDPETLPTLLQLFSTSRFLGDVLVNDPESLELLRLTNGQPVGRDYLVSDLVNELQNLRDRNNALAALRRHKRRETLRIAYGDIVKGQRLSVVTQQISFLADALCEAALAFAQKRLQSSRGVPRGPGGSVSRFVVLAMGKLGGEELNYSSDIDLICLYDGEGRTDGEKKTSNVEYYDRLCRDFVKLLTENTELGSVYRVDMRLRPHGERAPLVHSRDAALHYYDVSGRTWERQAFVKCRPVAGDLDLGHEFLAVMEPWIYRRYLNRADITGVKALKRKIEQRVRREGMDERDVKTGHGGIRDIEFVIQFLQLLNGGDLPALRTGNTLEAITRLAKAGCLTLTEQNILEANYTYLRKVEHLLQIMLDVQTHALPDNDVELGKLALRMGYTDDEGKNALQQFRDDYRERTEKNRLILDHLLHDAFADDAKTEPEIDLVLDPDPKPEQIDSILAAYGFQDVQAAYRNLCTLATEKIPFLSTRRCRHFLASIAPALLQAVGQTPDPDAALVNLVQVSDSLGGKGVLWELFSFNAPTLQLYVRLCASSPYLSSILTSNPGMLDELMDSLVINRLPNIQTLKLMLEDRARGAEDLELILHSFKNVHHLNAGVRDILGKDDIRTTTAFLADVAEVCLAFVANAQFERLVQRFGRPWNTQEDRACEMVILGMGKLGGREPNYHSDLDVVFLFETDGNTKSVRNGSNTTSNKHFFSELAQRITKYLNRIGPNGRLYELDARLRPTGKSGALAISFDGFTRYFTSGGGQLWERQALCRARPLTGSHDVRVQVQQVIRSIVESPSWQPEFARKIRQMRLRMQENASPRNIKRSEGGLVDIEFIAQMLQLKHLRDTPEVLQPGTLEALAELAERGFLASEDENYLQESYRFLRSIEARLRLMNTTARHDLPDDPRELQKLAYLLESESGERLQERCLAYLRENRTCFDRVFQQASG